jgi:hypothetical protein
MTKQIPLSPQGKRRGQFFAIVDDEDFERASKYAWYVSPHRKTMYARHRPDGNNMYRSLHRFLLGVTPSQIIDHVNGNGLDNRRCNIRVCTISQNRWNEPIRKTNKSGFKGVSFHKQVHRWMAHIKFHRKSIYLGLFDDPAMAARAYDKKARELFGEFAWTNFS